MPRSTGFKLGFHYGASASFSSPRLLCILPSLQSICNTQLYVEVCNTLKSEMKQRLLLVSYYPAVKRLKLELRRLLTTGSALERAMEIQDFVTARKYGTKPDFTSILTIVRIPTRKDEKQMRRNASGHSRLSKSNDDLLKGRALRG
jgi:hypothetical protein